MTDLTGIKKSMGVYIDSDIETSFTNCTFLKVYGEGIEVGEDQYPYKLFYSSYTRVVSCSEECHLSTMLEF